MVQASGRVNAFRALSKGRGRKKGAGRGR